MTARANSQMNWAETNKMRSDNPLIFLIETLFDLYIIVLMLRFILPQVRGSLCDCGRVGYSYFVSSVQGYEIEPNGWAPSQRLSVIQLHGP